MLLLFKLCGCSEFTSHWNARYGFGSSLRQAIKSLTFVQSLAFAFELSFIAFFKASGQILSMRRRTVSFQFSVLNSPIQLSLDARKCPHSICWCAWRVFFGNWKLYASYWFTKSRKVLYRVFVAYWTLEIDSWCPCLWEPLPSHYGQSHQKFP